MILTSDITQTTLCISSSMKNFSTLEDDVEPTRFKIDQQMARDALCSLLAKQQEIRITALSQLQLNDKFQLQHFPDSQISLSHSKGIGVAALGFDALAIGVDLEWQARKLSSELFERTKKLLPSIAYDFSPLDYWCFREALIKACSALGVDYANITCLIPEKNTLLVKADQVTYLGKWEILAINYLSNHLKIHVLKITKKQNL